ncbi:putative replication initiation protein (plasmid) [Aliivibrio wodanis]|uniref:Putative replication initiation protein n=1 Tax=Aliivibrio wodanis TaxID=80852 RepID=A0A090I8P4_9GAMM|nr:putative replication initiation protein [Aliivibrio wodanis]
MINAPHWNPQESLDENGDLLAVSDRKKKHIPTLNRKVFNTIEKNGVWISGLWPQLVHSLIEAGMRKYNLSFRAVHKRNIENTLRWISYNSDAVTGCINVTRLCIEIGKEIGVSSSTISVIMKELVIMGLLYEPEHSGQSMQDILHDGRLPRTLCTTPLFYEIFGVKNDELKRLRSIEIERRKIEAAKRHEKYDADIALKTYCHSNILRVWEYRHTKTTSSYRVKLADMNAVERIAYISRKLVERIRAKGWQLNTDAVNITKMANNLLRRMGLAVLKSELPPPII